MAIEIKFGRHFERRNPELPLWDERGRAGGYLKAATDKLAAQGVRVVLARGTKEVTLTTADEWAKFISSEASSQAKTRDFDKQFGITFQDFINIIDDAARADDKEYILDLK